MRLWVVMNKALTKKKHGEISTKLRVTRDLCHSV